MPTLYLGEAETSAGLLREWCDREWLRASAPPVESEDPGYEQCWLQILRDQSRARDIAHHTDRAAVDLPDGPVRDVAVGRSDRLANTEDA
jgi:hypothetical protein